MENYAYLIDTYRRFGRALEDQIIKDLTLFVATNGKPDDEKERVTFDFNRSETYKMLPSISVPVYDSSEYDRLYAPLQKLYIEKAGKSRVRLWYCTDNYEDSIVYVDTLGLCNLHSILKAIEDGEYADLKIEDGKIVVKK